MTPAQFIAKWQATTLSERSACQQHFLDLCELLGQPKPAEADPQGEWFTFEKGVTTTDGGGGWADVWMRDRFGWEYKGKHKDLKAAYSQLLKYREDLGNPPLLVVCDMDRFEVHTNFTGTAKKVYAFNLEELARPDNLQTLRAVFTEPERLKPGLSTRSVTEQASELLGKLADGMRMRGIAPPAAAHFLMKLMFCMFAEDIDLLPSKVFSRSLAASKKDPNKLAKTLHALFEAMAHGGNFGADEILYFNGGLFADADVIELTAGEIATLVDTAEFDWSDVEPHIFGTLFERTLDPAKRSQIGAHYTSREDITTLLEPVMMAPLRREWQAVKEKCLALVPKLEAERKKAVQQRTASKKDSKPRRDFDKLLRDFVARLSHVSVLDPACGSGNFLYVALHLLLDLEKEVISFAAKSGLGLLPQVRPTQLAGLEINPYAQQLAQVVIWIGYLQWMHDNGFNPPSHPVLEPIESIRLMDAILDLSDPEHPKEPDWPSADYIVGNPPFLGGNKLRSELGDHYVESLFGLYRDRVPALADLCAYWFERSRERLILGACQRVGLLATQGIRGSASRDVLERIKKSGDIFFAISDRNWFLDGAAVHVSLVGFDNGRELSRLLDDVPVSEINANLTSNARVTSAVPLKANLNICFMGASKKASFDIAQSTAIGFLLSPNPLGNPNSNVVLPWANGMDITRRTRDMWIIDYGPSMSEGNAAAFEAPFEYAKKTIKEERKGRREQRIADNWWRFGRPRVDMRRATTGLKRFLVTPAVAKFRLFVWLTTPIVPDQQLLVFATEDDYYFGVLQSRLHDRWAYSLGGQVRERESGFRYTPTTCFETFPFPEPTDEQRQVIGMAAKELDDMRTAWLNPPEWTRTEVLEFPGSSDGPWARYIDQSVGWDQRLSGRAGPPLKSEISNLKSQISDAGGPALASSLVPPYIGTVRYPRLVPQDADCAKELKKRTLTNLYNQRPTWLDLAHQKLDAAVFAAYGWPASLSDDELLARLLALNLKRSPR